jgi:hypothetical protein
VEIPHHGYPSDPRKEDADFSRRNGIKREGYIDAKDNEVVRGGCAGGEGV